MPQVWEYRNSGRERADATIPTSAAQTGAQYIIQGQRGTDMGTACEAVVVQFGTDGSGTFSINGQSTAIKMAA